MFSWLIVTSALVGEMAAPGATWTAPAECPDAEAVLQAAEEYGASVRDASMNLEGHVEVIEGGYRLELSIRTPTGTTTRELHAESCDALTRAAGLVLSVAVDPMRVPEPLLEPASASSAPHEVEPADRTPVVRDREELATQRGRVEPAAPATPPAPRPAIGGSVVASGMLGRGIVPSLDTRAQLGAAIDMRRIRAELLGFHAFARDVRAPDRPGVGATVHGWGGSLRVGPRWDNGSFVFACPTGVEFAAVVGEGFGVDRAWRRVDLAWSVLIAPGLQIPIGRRVAVGADVELGVAVRRPAFVVGTPRILHRVPRIGARGGARVEVRFSGAPGDQNRNSRRPR